MSAASLSRLAATVLLIAGGAILPGAAARASRTARSSTVTSGTFHGKTAQGIPVWLGRPHGRRRWFRYQARLRCSDGSTFTDDAFSDLVTIQSRAFARSVTSDSGAVHTRITGTFSGRRAHGTIRIGERYSEVADAQGDTPLSANGGILCESGTVRWTASAGRG